MPRMADCPNCDPSKAMHVTVISVFAFLALLFVPLRLWARVIKKKGIGRDDYLCVGGLVFTLAMTIFTVQSYVYWGFFSHSVTGNSEIVVTQFKALLVGQLLWITAVTFIRASIIFLYIRIFCTKPFRNACYTILVINSIYFAATVLACCLICQPFAYNWDQSIHGTCGNQKSLDLFIGVFNLLMDIATIALPMPVLWGLQMPPRRKVAVSAMFSMGTAICIITLVRIIVTTDITAENTAAQYALIALLTNLECSLGVVNACLPVTRPVFEKLNPTSLIRGLLEWTSSRRRSARSGEYEMPSRPTQIGFRLENQPERIVRRNPQDSAINLPNAVRTSPLSQREVDVWDGR